MRGAARGGADGDDTGRGACSAAAVLRRPACWVLHVTHRVAVTCFLGAWDDSPTQLRRTESPRHPELNCFTRELTETAPGLTSGRTRPASGPQDGASRWADHCQPDLSLWVPGAAVAPTPDTCAHGPGLAPSCAITVRDTETRCRVCQRLVRLPSRSLPAASTVTTTFIQPPLSPASRVGGGAALRLSTLCRRPSSCVVPTDPPRWPRPAATLCIDGAGASRAAAAATAVAVAVLGAPRQR